MNAKTFRPADKGVILDKNTKVRLTYTGEIFTVIKMDKDFMTLKDENLKVYEYPTTFEITVLQ